jgi:putative SOS response-associated peptidase YedK
VIIVGKSNAVVAKVHDRMPVILMPDDYDRWLDPNTSPDALLAMLKPYDLKLMEGLRRRSRRQQCEKTTPSSASSRHADGGSHR